MVIWTREGYAVTGGKNAYQVVEIFDSDAERRGALIGGRAFWDGCDCRKGPVSARD